MRALVVVLLVCLPAVMWAPVPGSGGTPANPDRNTDAQRAKTGSGLSGENKLVDAMNNDYVMVWRTLMAPKNVSDAFGRRIGKRYIAMQITIANRNKEFQWLVQDASVDLAPLLTHLDEKGKDCEPNFKLLLDRLDRQQMSGAVSASRVSSADLTVLRGVSEKGEALDPRNLTLRLLTGAGSVAGGLIGVTTFGPAFAPSVAVFNGPFLNAANLAFPDFTTNQLNRLNDSAFLANTVVGKQQAKVIVIFIPMEYLLTKKQAEQFWKNPETIFTCPDLRLLEAFVDGNFITTVIPTPVITSITVKPNENLNFAKDEFTVHGEVVGRFLKDAKVALANPPDGVTIAADGDASEERLPFVLTGKKPQMPGDALHFEVKLGEAEPVKSDLPISYPVATPTLAAGALDPAEVSAGTKTIKVTGTNFLPRDMQVLVEPAAGITVGPITYVSNTELQVELTVAPGTTAGTRQVRISGKGGTTNPATTITIK